MYGGKIGEFVLWSWSGLPLVARKNFILHSWISSEHFQLTLNYWNQFTFQCTCHTEDTLVWGPSGWHIQCTPGWRTGRLQAEEITGCWSETDKHINIYYWQTLANPKNKTKKHKQIWLLTHLRQTVSVTAVDSFGLNHKFMIRWLNGYLRLRLKSISNNDDDDSHIWDHWNQCLLFSKSINLIFACMIITHFNELNSKILC